MSSSPRPMVTQPRAGGRRKTESESSADSFIEFSASVESTDSFCIVFESAGGCLEDIVGGHDDDDDDDDDWEDDDGEEEDSEEDDEDLVFNYSSSLNDDFCADTVLFQTEEDDQLDCSGRLQPAKKKKAKSVSFDEDHLACIIEFEDDPASKDSRETYWEMLARDRARFQDRILRTGDILDAVLTPAHRAKVYKQRFTEQI